MAGGGRQWALRGGHLTRHLLEGTRHWLYSYMRMYACLGSRLCLDASMHLTASVGVCACEHAGACEHPGCWWQQVWLSTGFCSVWLRPFAPPLAVGSVRWGVCRTCLTLHLHLSRLWLQHAPPQSCALMGWKCLVWLVLKASQLAQPTLKHLFI